MSADAAVFSLDRIGQIAIMVKDLARATAFYRDVLGMRFLFEVPGRMAFFDCGGVRLLLEVPEDAAYANHASILYYRVADLAGAYRTLGGRGASFVGAPHLIARMPDHELWMAFLRDSEDNTLALMSEVRPS
jgi:catechol 2,3-dioxygenase-like lactoylglutathione lyase family enzyme